VEGSDRAGESGKRGGGNEKGGRKDGREILDCLMSVEKIARETGKGGRG